MRRHRHCSGQFEDYLLFLLRYPDPMHRGVFNGVRLVPATRFLVAVLFASVLWIVAGPGAGSAHAEVPVYVGDMGFPAIQDASGPEEYSWKVQLAGNQGLEQLGDQTVIIYYVSDHTTALKISTQPAHDAVGANVPTTLEAAGGDVITLTVHHRAGNPKAGGAPFDYPVLGGSGFESSYQPAIVQMPPDEAIDIEPFKEDHCIVPALKGKSLRVSRRQLARSGCSLGRVIRRAASRKSAKVFGQNPRAGTTLKPGGQVSVKLG
jgi:hypothetical protein